MSPRQRTPWFLLQSGKLPKDCPLCGTELRVANTSSSDCIIYTTRYDPCGCVESASVRDYR